MTPNEAENQAQAYIDKVLASQRALGHETTVSDADYQRAVARAGRALADLAEPAPNEEEEAIPAL